MGRSDGSAGKESASNARDTGDTGLIPGLRDPPEREMVTQFSILT